MNLPADIDSEVEFMAVDEIEGSVDPMAELLPPKEASLYRGIVARVNFLAADRSNSRTRTHQTRVANLYATRTEIPSPNTNLYGVMHFTYCSE